MEPDEYRRLSKLESEFWWFRGMERISVAVLERHGRLPDNPHRTILDAGCGTGGMLRVLQQYGLVIGVDQAPLGLKLAQTKLTTPLVRATVAGLPFGAETFDLVTSFDVLYHRNVADDATALDEFNRVLKKRGTLLMRVPAYNRLRSRHDEAVHTIRRYGKSELVAKLRSAGLEPTFVSFANSVLLPFAIVRRLTESWWSMSRTGSEVEPVAGWLNGVLTAVLATEAAMLRHFALPFGLSLLAVARKEG